MFNSILQQGCKYHVQHLGVAWYRGNWLVHLQALRNILLSSGRFQTDQDLLNKSIQLYWRYSDTSLKPFKNPSDSSPPGLNVESGLPDGLAGDLSALLVHRQPFTQKANVPLD